MVQRESISAFFYRKGSVVLLVVTCRIGVAIIAAELARNRGVQFNVNVCRFLSVRFWL